MDSELWDASRECEKALDRDNLPSRIHVQHLKRCVRRAKQSLSNDIWRNWDKLATAYIDANGMWLNVVNAKKACTDRTGNKALLEVLKRSVKKNLREAERDQAEDCGNVNTIYKKLWRVVIYKIQEVEAQFATEFAEIHRNEKMQGHADTLGIGPIRF